MSLFSRSLDYTVSVVSVVHLCWFLHTPPAPLTYHFNVPLSPLAPFRANF